MLRIFLLVTLFASLICSTPNEKILRTSIAYKSRDFVTEITIGRRHRQRSVYNCCLWNIYVKRSGTGTDQGNDLRDNDREHNHQTHNQSTFDGLKEHPTGKRIKLTKWKVIVNSICLKMIRMWIHSYFGNREGNHSWSYQKLLFGSFQLQLRIQSWMLIQCNWQSYQSSLQLFMFWYGWKASFYQMLLQSLSVQMDWTFCPIKSFVSFRIRSRVQIRIWNSDPFGALPCKSFFLSLCSGLSTTCHPSPLFVSRLFSNSLV